ncbi:MAG: type I pullulanase [Sarcina sp.]
MSGKSYYDSYSGNDLGLVIENGKYKFRLWAPKAEKVFLNIYEDYDKNVFKEYLMEKSQGGTYYLELESSLEGKFYTYKVVRDGKELSFQDPYSKAVAVNGDRTAIIDMENTNPEGFLEHKGPTFKDGTDAIICEISIRDISIDEKASLKNKGKFLALTENQQGELKDKVGLSYLKEMGFTHLQLMPIYDFETIDERESVKQGEDSYNYNWGYDPKNYNVVEGSYSSDPFNPKSRIIELKKAIKNIHENGMAVIMDVVYNHLYDYKGSSFEKSCPNYFFRNNNGKIIDETGCGNSFASEKEMARKFIVDSVKYWVNEYKIDGFRFDLMGILDVETMRVVRDELKKINSNIFIIGEGWDMGTVLRAEEKAKQGNAKNLRDIGFFNDTMRDALRGSGFIEGDKGFVTGDLKKVEGVKKSIVAGINYYKSHSDKNYVVENYTDKNCSDKSCSGESYNKKIYDNKQCKESYNAYDNKEYDESYSNEKDNKNSYHCENCGETGKENIVTGNNILTLKESFDLWGDAYPNQVVNYVECHDNYTLYDKLALENLTEEEIKQCHRLATSIVLLSQGISFLHLGQEFFRSKKGVENSYNAPDKTNKINWIDKEENLDNVEYVKGLIELRKSDKLFRMNNSEEIRKNLTFLDLDKEIIAYKLERNIEIEEDNKLNNKINSEKTNSYVVIHNSSKNEKKINIELLIKSLNKNLEKDSILEILVNKNRAGIKSIETIKNYSNLKVESRSTMVIKL